MILYWRSSLFVLLLSTAQLGFGQDKEMLAPTINGYKGIWFTLGQFYEYGDKYSGGLGTYTAKHRPLALYDAAVDQTFFVYGGTTKPKAKHLLCSVWPKSAKSLKLSK